MLHQNPTLTKASRKAFISTICDKHTKPRGLSQRVKNKENVMAMFHWASRIKIAGRLYLIIGIVVLGIAALVAMSSHYNRTSLLEARSQQTRRLIETAYSLLAEYKARVDSGELTLVDSQKRALKRLESLRYDKTNYFWVNDMNGKMLMHPTSPKLVGTDVRELKDARGVNFFVDMINVVKKDSEGVYEYQWPPDKTAKPKVSYVKGYPEWGWIIGTGTFVDEVMEEAWQTEKKLLIAASLVLLIAILVALLIGRSISNPIRTLTKSMQKLASGDTSGNTGMMERGDEIGEMAKTVRVFQDNAKQVEKLKAEQAEMERRAVEDKKRAMAKMADDFEQSVGQIVNVVASAATELQSNAKHLSEMAEQTSRQSATVAAATEEASTSVQTVASATEELSASIGEINRQVVESSNIAMNAVEEVKKTNSTVSTLAEAATQIGDVVKLIQDIAEQTNLLALNATIEAARAGEAGKGFAVVASEVKNLATQTARATEEISKKIVTVQSVSTEAANAIRGIGVTIEKISEITGTIASAIHEQTAATKEISNNVQQASAGTSEVSSSIVSVTQTAKESGGAAEEVLQASNELSKQSERLRAEVGSFINKVKQG
jgi:methyl-accepting chemotaxis protein